MPGDTLNIRVRLTECVRRCNSRRSQYNPTAGAQRQTSECPVEVTQTAMSERLQGHTALVTGASRGVGKGIALELARAGCRVAVNYHTDAAPAEQTVAEIEKLGAEAFAVRADVASSDRVKEMFDLVLSRFGQLNIMVNNAGVQTWKPLLELSELDWDRVIDTNLKGTFLCTQFAARNMKEH